MACMKVRVESHSKIPIKISELWARAKLPLPNTTQQPPLESLVQFGTQGKYRTKPGMYRNAPPCRNLLLPLLNFCIAEGRETREAVLLMVMNHVLRDVFDGRKGT